MVMWSTTPPPSQVWYKLDVDQGTHREAFYICGTPTIELVKQLVCGGELLGISEYKPKKEHLKISFIKENL